jgi:hypothetical protein
MSNSNVEERTGIKVCVKFLLEMQRGAVSMTMKQISKQAVKNISISKSQEILHDEITCETSAYCFL